MAKKESIVFIVDQLEAGGLERQLFYLIRALVAHQTVDVHCFVWNHRTSAFYFDRVRDCIGDQLTGADPDVGFRQKQKSLNQLVKSIHPRWIISFSNFTNFQAAIAGWFSTGTPIGSIRSSAAYMLDSLGPKTLLSLLFPKRFISNSTVAIQEFKAVWWMRRQRFRHFPNYIDLDNFAPSSETKDYFSISVGTLLPEKRLNRLIDLMDEVRSNYPDIQHIHLGDGPLMDAFQSEVKARGLDQTIRFAGSQKDVPSFLAKAEVFLHFSDFEGTPNVVLEAMAMGLPVITTNCGDVASLVVHEQNGYVLPRADKYDPIAFRNRFLELKKDINLKHTMGQQSLKLIQRFDSRKMAVDFLAEINQFN